MIYHSSLGFLVFVLETAGFLAVLVFFSGASVFLLTVFVVLAVFVVLGLVTMVSVIIVVSTMSISTLGTDVSAFFLSAEPQLLESHSP